MLIQTQLSNYDTKGNFILEADSGWQMVMGRVREMLRLVPDLEIDILGPRYNQLITLPYDINQDVFDNGRVNYIPNYIIPNALATRYDFDMMTVLQALNLKDPKHIKYDWVYINDPMHLRNFKALFHLYGKYTPKFAVHSHFIDNPSCPKFPAEASLWLGQVEASIRADVNFWQCQSALCIYKEEASSLLHSDVLDEVMRKSFPWDDGYSQGEINAPLDFSKIRFDRDEFHRRTYGKQVLFVPNRIGGRGRSSDYTNCGKFLFEILPELHRRLPNLAVIAGNPSQKFSNRELEDELGQYGFINLVPDSLRRDEYRWVGMNSEISISLYDQDSYGGTAARELVELGSLPVWLDNYEYGKIARELSQDGDLEILTPTLDPKDVIAAVERVSFMWRYGGWPSQIRLKEIVRKRCSYEETTKEALSRMEIM